MTSEAFFIFMEEIWKNIIIKECHTYYSVSNLGRISSQWKGSIKIMKLQIGNHGYPCIGLITTVGRCTYLVHRVVAKYFLPDFDELLEVNHIDGIKTNSAYWNLEMTTRSENQLHAYRTGLSEGLKGEDSRFSKLKNNDVLYIFNSTETCVEIAKKYGIDDSTVSNIRTGKLWRHLTGKTYEKSNRLNIDEVLEIYKSKEDTLSASKKFDVSRKTITSIRSGKIWSGVTGAQYSPHKRTLTEKDVINIFNSTESHRILSERYNIHYSSIYDIKNGRSHSSVTKTLPVAAG